MVKDQRPTRSAAQKQAEARYNKKRRGMPAIPAIRLTEEEAAFCEAVFACYEGSKKEAVLEGLALLSKQSNRP